MNFHLVFFLCGRTDSSDFRIPTHLGTVHAATAAAIDTESIPYHRASSL